VNVSFFFLLHSHWHSSLYHSIFPNITLAIIVAIFILLFDLLRGKENSDPQVGYWFLAIGIALLISAYFVSSNYGISFEALDQDKSFPKLVRGLPYYGVSSLTMGAIIVAKSLFTRR